jgi:molecular chaperone DnaJ
MPKDYYIVLGISRDAGLSRIKKAYRDVIKKHHPDITRSDESTARFLEIREAYEVLSDEVKRRMYDRELAGTGPSAEASKAPETKERRRAAPGDAWDLGLPAFDRLPGGFGRFFGASREVHLEAVMSPEEAAEGGLFPIAVPVLIRCPGCSRRGPLEVSCPVCRGLGRVRTEREFSLEIPPRLRHGTRLRFALEPADVILYVRILVDPGLS